MIFVKLTQDLSTLMICFHVWVHGLRPNEHSHFRALSRELPPALEHVVKVMITHETSLHKLTFEANVLR